MTKAIGLTVRRIPGDLFIAALGLATTFATVVLIFVAGRALGIALQTIMLAGLLPAGAVATGLLAPTGFYLGARILNRKPSPVVLVAMLASTIAAYLLLQYATYRSVSVGDQPLRRAASFSQYLAYASSHSRVSFFIHGTPAGTTGDLGAWTLLLTGLQLLGFVGGGVTLYSYLLAQPYCNACRNYLRRTGEQFHFDFDDDRFAAHTAAVTAALRSSDPGSAVALHAATASSQTDSGDDLRSRLVTFACAGCGRTHYVLDGWRKNARDEWILLTGSAVSTYSIATAPYTQHY